MKMDMDNRCQADLEYLLKQTRNTLTGRQLLSLGVLVCFLSAMAAAANVSIYDITSPGNTVVGVPEDDEWPGNEAPANVIDNNSNTKYLHFGGQNSSTGFQVAPNAHTVPVTALVFTTANDAPERDPVSYELYGSNTSISGPYELIASGEIVDFKQDIPWPRYTPNNTPVIFPNDKIYTCYQVMFPNVRYPSGANSMQIAEVDLLALPGGVWPPTIDAGSDQIMVLPQHQITLNGAYQTLGDSNVPVAVQWELTGQPEGVDNNLIFYDPDNQILDPRVVLPAIPGTYTFTLTVTVGPYHETDSVSVTLAQSFCPPQDLDGDCLVGITDLLMLAQTWLHADSPVMQLPDFDQSGQVSMTDYASMAQSWLTTGPEALITEFVALNVARYPPLPGELLDEDYDSSDWLELYNPANLAVDLTGYFLTDNPLQLRGWQIPGLILQPGEFRIIYASGKDRTNPNAPLHTDFALNSDSGYLALVRPDGKTIVHQYDYPRQYGYLSFGLTSPAGTSVREVELVGESSPVRAWVPTDESSGQIWRSLSFDDTNWLSGLPGVGFDLETTYIPYIGLDVRQAMYGKNSSVYLRIPFEVSDLSNLSNLKLQMRYDDGFAAWMNESPVIASANVAQPLKYNSSATLTHNDSLAVKYQTFELNEDVLDYLRIGQNILTIQGVNRQSGNNDLLISPRLTVLRKSKLDLTSQIATFMLPASPGMPNLPGMNNPGPAIAQTTDQIVPPAADQNIIITTQVDETDQPVDSVTLIYVVGFGAEIQLTMRDDGMTPDSTALDGIFTASIPASAYGPGDMVRWAVVADDTAGRYSRDPVYLSVDNAPRYFGTVVQNPGLAENIPVLQLFVQNSYAANTDTGTRGSVFYRDQFYDNIFIRHRGGFSTFGNKIKFNDGYLFEFDPDYERVDEINLNTAGSDPAYIRQIISWDTYARAGLPASLCYPLLLITNNNAGEFRLFVEQPDRHLLRRVGLDDDGALYKAYTDLNINLTGEQTPSLRKVTRRYEDLSDAQALAAGIDPGNPQRAQYLFDNINIPAVINYMAASVIIHDNDLTHKNYFIYRDTNGSGEWMFMPWDKDLTFGVNSGIPNLTADRDWIEEIGDIRGPSHPFFGDYLHEKIDYKWNRLIDAVTTNPVSREMYLRRLRTLMDEWLQPVDTPADQLHFEQQIDALSDLLWPQLGSDNFLANLEAIKTDYLAPRRVHLYQHHAMGSDWPGCANIPDAQPAQFALQFGTIEFNPSTGNQDDEYIELINPNAVALDLSNYQIAGGVEYRFPAGAVIPSENRLFLSPDVVAFRSRSQSPTGGECHLVLGNYKGHLSNWGESIQLLDPQGNLVVETSYAGEPSDAQRYVRISEIMYHPADSANPAYVDEDYEFIELINIGDMAVSLANISFTDGIQYTFDSNASLNPGQFALLVKNPLAFSERYAIPGETLIFGPYEGFLDNGDETIVLDDASGSTILDFQYKDGWYPLTDGQGFSLTINNPQEPDLDSWNNKEAWHTSVQTGGSPGAADQALPLGAVVFNEILAVNAAGLSPWIELHNTLDIPVSIEGWFLSNTPDNLALYPLPPGLSIPAHHYLLIDQNSYFGSAFSLDAMGQTLYLTSGVNGQLTGYQTIEDYGPSITGLSYGRHVKSNDNPDFVILSSPTPGQPNTLPRVGPIVFNEVMYHPALNNDAEYLELLNISNDTVNLWESNALNGLNTGWRLQDSDGIMLEFPDTVSLAPGEILLIIKDINAYTAEFGPIPTDIQVIVWTSNSLSNGGEKVDLYQPQFSPDGDAGWLRIDRINYDDSDPWPTDPDGNGASLHRIQSQAYGNDPANWLASEPSPGTE